MELEVLCSTVTVIILKGVRVFGGVQPDAILLGSKFRYRSAGLGKLLIPDQVSGGCLSDSRSEHLRWFGAFGDDERNTFNVVALQKSELAKRQAL